MGYHERMNAHVVIDDNTRFRILNTEHSPPQLAALRHSQPTKQHFICSILSPTQSTPCEFPARKIYDMLIDSLRTKDYCSHYFKTQSSTTFTTSSLTLSYLLVQIQNQLNKSKPDQDKI